MRPCTRLPKEAFIFMAPTRQDIDRILADLYQVMDQDVPFERKATNALEIGKEFLGVDNAHLTTVDPRSDHWRAIASTDPPAGSFPAGLELDTTYCRRTVTQDTSIRLHDARSQGWADDPAYREHGLPTYHGTALRVNGTQVFGTLCFVSERPRGAPFFRPGDPLRRTTDPDARIRDRSTGAVPGDFTMIQPDRGPQPDPPP